MISTGLQEMLSEKLDPRRTYALGISLIIGLGTGFVPDVFERLPGELKVFFAEPLSATTILVVVLYQLLHLDLLIAKRRERNEQRTARPSSKSP